MQDFKTINKKTIFSVSAAILLIIGFYLIFLKGEKSELTLFQVIRGNVVEEIFESGQVVRGERINLNFKSPGKIEAIHVKVGDEVEQGQLLAELDNADLYLQLEETKAALLLAQLNLEKLLEGASEEEIRIVENQAEAARISMEMSKEASDSSYQSAVAVLDSSYPQIYNTLEFVKDFIKAYITIYDEDARKITRMRDVIEESQEKARISLEAVKKNQNSEKEIETALLTMKNSLETTFNSLEEIRKIVDSSFAFKGSVSTADKASFDIFKTSLNNALSSVISVRQAVFSTKLGFEAAEIKFEEANNRLSLIKSGARQTDIDFYQTQVRQAQTRVKLYENQLSHSRLVSPIKGKVAEIGKSRGEFVQPAPQDAIMVIIPFVPYEVKVDIYEEDIIKVSVGNRVKISLIAFPDKIFEGNIVSIDPAEKLIDNIVYYEARIGLGENIDNLRSGMTSDLVIETDLRENVLIVPRDAIQRKDDRIIVEVFKEGEIEEREARTGIRGSDGMVEMISGLDEGEEVVIR